MKVLIIAAGEGKRFRPFSLTIPKQIIPVLDKPSLFYLIGELLKLFKERDIIIIGSDKIREIVKAKYKDIQVVKQRLYYGTALAAYAARKLVKEDFILINGDIYSDINTIKQLLNYENAIVGYTVNDPKNYGVFIVEGNKIKGWVEKPVNLPSNIVNAGIYKFSSYFWDYLEEIIEAEIVSERGEFELTDVVNKILQNGNNFYLVKANEWIHLTYPWDLLKIDKYFFEKEYKRLEKNYKELGYNYIYGFFVDNKSTIENYVVLKGKGIIKESEIKSFTYVEGMVYINESIIGPFARLRDYVSLHGKNKVGNFVEIKNSIIMEGTKILHHNYIGDSVIGRNVNFGAGTKIANLRHDENAVKVKMDNTEIDTKLRKFGAIIGDNVKIGINVSIMPGTVIYPNVKIYPGSVVKGIVQ